MKKALIFLSLLALLGAGYAGNEYNLFRHVALTAAYHDVQRSFSVKRKPTVVCWGDSLTAGFGASALHDFPTLLALLFDVPAINEGIPKETSAQIKARFLARKKSAGPEHVVIWAGRNSFSPDVAPRDIAEMVASLPPGSKFLIIGVPNGDYSSEYRGGPNYEAILKTNAILSETYGPHFVPIREILVAAASPSDAEDVTRDVVPSSLRSDPLHLNNAGQVVVAMAVRKAMVANGW